MDAYYADEFVLPLPEGHRFPMAKYRLLRDRIAEGVETEEHHHFLLQHGCRAFQGYFFGRPVPHTYFERAAPRAKRR